jgi:hypothetical protein
MGDHICTYGEYSLFMEREYEEDNVKNFYFVYRDSIYIGMMPSSPYSFVSSSDFQRWIDCGMPSRETMGGHHRSDLSKYYDIWLDNQLDKLLVQEMTDAL